MKTLLAVLTCLLAGVWIAAAQPSPVAPANQTEVNAGTIHTKFVAPDTLASYVAGAIVGATGATNGLTSNQVYSLVFTTVGGISNRQSGVILPSGTFSNAFATNATIQGNVNGDQIRVNLFTTGMNTNATPAYSLVTINSNRFTSSSLIAGLSGDWILTNLGNGFNIWTKVTGGNANTNAWASNATAHVFVKNSVGTFIFTNDTFESSKPWRVQVPAATAGSVTNFQMQFWRNYTNGAFASESSPSNISYGNIGSMATFTPSRATIRTNMSIDGLVTIGGGGSGTALLEINATNYPNITAFLMNYTGGSISADNVAGFRITGSLTLAIPASHPALLRQAMFNYAPDVTWATIGIPGPAEHLETWYSDYINNVTVETNAAFINGMVLGDRVTRFHTNRFIAQDFYNWMSPFASVEFISGTTNSDTNGLFGIGVSNNLFRIGPVNLDGTFTGTGINMDTNGNFTGGSGSTFSTVTNIVVIQRYSGTNAAGATNDTWSVSARNNPRGSLIALDLVQGNQFELFTNSALLFPTNVNAVVRVQDFANVPTMNVTNLNAATQGVNQAYFTNATFVNGLSVRMPQVTNVSINAGTRWTNSTGYDLDMRGRLHMSGTVPVGASVLITNSGTAWPDPTDASTDFNVIGGLNDTDPNIPFSIIVTNNGWLTVHIVTGDGASLYLKGSRMVIQ